MPEPFKPAAGLLKTAPIPITEPSQPVVAVATAPTQMLSAPSWEGVPIDLIRYMGKDIGTMNTKDIEQLKDIDTWSKKGLLEDSIGNRLSKLKELEQKLGAPNYHETKMSRLWSWVKMDMSINEIRTRQLAFER